MFRPLATSALALILGAGAALADLTPAQVWENVERSLTDAGSEVEIGSRDDSGDRLVLEDVVLRAPAEAEGRFSVTFPRMVFEDAGDGQVRSVVEGDMQFVARSTDMSGEESGFDMVVQMPGNETISSGTVDDMRHVYTIPELRLTGSAADSEGEAPVTVSMTDIAGNQTIRLLEDGGNEQTYEISAAAMDMTIAAESTATEIDDAAEGEDSATDGTAPGATDSFEGTFRIENMTITGEGTTPGGVAGFDVDPAEALRAGMDGTATFAVGPMTGAFKSMTSDYAGQQQEGRGSFSAESGELTAALSAAGLTLDTKGVNSNVKIQSSGMDMMPVSYGMAEWAFGLVLPMLADEAEQPFGLTYRIGGLTLDDALWSIFDPEAKLPRDPANLDIDIDGQAVLVADLMDPEAVEAEDMPFLPRSLTVNRMSLDAVGASAEVTGALTFGDDPTQPVGSITGNFTGIDALMDTMVAMGLLPQEQLMGTRMMMAMFARPVDGDANRLRTEMEFREDGSIFANGQQVK
ncbi:MAG: DUF2125 domain-containing protein [Paracoccus sp. (in: a-proteobacteria)]|uniref:DUF2125 domain-containing protein n=1 Tax=Paracoccus sp. TaxID=267 RepID=UPI003919B995